MATCADLVQAKLPADAGVDSVSIVPALLGKDDQPLREAVVHHSIQGAFSIRQGDWKLELCPGSGGWSAPRPGRANLAKLPPIQLYNLKEDIGETNNVQAKHPQVVKKLTSLLQSYVDQGRSTQGPTQANQGEVNIYRASRAAQKKK